jgi:hypothetical protein
MLFSFNFGLIAIYAIIKSIFGIIILFKYYIHENIKININKIILTIPYIIVSIYILVIIISNHIRWGNRIYEIIITLFIFIGNIIWEYYWIYLYEKKNISKEYIYLYCGLFPFFLYGIFFIFI